MQDYHIHTTYSPDGHATMEEQIVAAERAGLSEICITDHLDIGHHEKIFDAPVDYDRWLSDMAQLRARHPGVAVRAGIEAGEQPCATLETQRVVSAHPFDYVLLSQHMIDGVDPYYYERYLGGRTPEAAFYRYAECVWESINRFPDFDCLAHLGYCAKFAPQDAGVRPFDRAYAPEIVDAILKKLAQEGKALEINTSGLKNGGASTIPGPDIVRRFIELGGEFVMLGSDAHYAQYVGYELERARRMALECGVRYTLSFIGRKGTPRAL